MLLLSVNEVGAGDTPFLLLGFQILGGSGVVPLVWLPLTVFYMRTETSSLGCGLESRVRLGVLGVFHVILPSISEGVLHLLPLPH